MFNRFLPSIISRMINRTLGGLVGAALASLIFVFLSGIALPSASIVQMFFASQAAAVVGGVLGLWIDAKMRLTSDFIAESLMNGTLDPISAIEQLPIYRKRSLGWLTNNVLVRLLDTLPRIYVRDIKSLSDVLLGLEVCLSKINGDINISFQDKLYLS